MEFSNCSAHLNLVLPPSFALTLDRCRLDGVPRLVTSTFADNNWNQLRFSINALDIAHQTMLQESSGSLPAALTANRHTSES
jgi:hypothetical protein